MPWTVVDKVVRKLQYWAVQERTNRRTPVLNITIQFVVVIFKHLWRYFILCGEIFEMFGSPLKIVFFRKFNYAITLLQQFIDEWLPFIKTSSRITYMLKAMCCVLRKDSLRYIYHVFKISLYKMRKRKKGKTYLIVIHNT